jgi:DNA-binding response OmpR family regulator
MSISLLARIIEPGDPGDPGGSSSYSIGLPGISIIEVEARRIGIGNREAVLRPQEFALFSYLYNHANQVCAKEELLEKALKGEYVESYVATLVSRIRQVIEEDPRRPRYLLTVPSTGYRLILKPE